MPKNWPPSLQIPDAYYIAIGKVASNWAAFEALVNSLLWQLAKVHDDRGACLTAQIANVARSLDRLIFQLQATPLDDILALVDAIDDHMDEFDKLANAVLVEIEPSVGDQQ